MKILIADDDLISRKMLQGILKDWGHEVMTATNGDEALQAMQADEPPLLAILDWEMPGLDGSQVCRAIRQRQTEKYPYLLLVTAKSQKSDLIRGLNAGADDFLSKPYDPLELKARVAGGQRIIELQEQLIAAREAMRAQAMRDSLTGAWNRGAIMGLLENELNRSRREGNPLGLIIADLDHFKRINDSFGHLAGDTALRAITQRIEQTMRPYDRFGRYGGEEFLIVLPGCDLTNTLKIGRRICRLVAQQPVPYLDTIIPVTISLGVGVSLPPEPLDLSALIREADKALYTAKRDGRNRVATGHGSSFHSD